MWCYLIEQLLCSGLFYALYKILFEGRIPHRAARIYLMSVAILAILIPALQLPLYHTPERAEKWINLVVTTDFYPAEGTTGEEAPSAEEEKWSEVITYGIGALYAVVAIAHLTIAALRIRGIRRLRKGAKLTACKGYILAESDRVEEPFSFLRTIFLNFRYRPHEREQIIAHEAAHVSHRHTAERLTMELLCSTCWFNPFIKAMGSRLIEVQEWEADYEVLKQGYNLNEYRKLIFHQLFGYNPDIACGLKNQTSKKRFMMMTTKTTERRSLMRLCAAIPLIAVMILTFGAVEADAQYTEAPTISETTDNEESSAQEHVLVEISKEGTIRLNGEETNLELLHQKLTKLRQKSGASCILSICADGECEMGKIQLLKEAAREAGIYQIRYEAPHEAVKKLTISDDERQKGVQVSEIRLTERNLLPILIKQQGSILTRNADGDMGIVAINDLKEIIKAFIDNNEHTPDGRKTKNDHYSDFTWQTIATDSEAGDIRHYPVSNGVISIGTDSKTPAKIRLEVEEIIRSAYGELREELAMQSFQQPLSSLNKWQREFIRQAIPQRVSESTPRE